MRRTVFDQAMRPFGITRSQWWVLANLSRHDGTGMMQTDLAQLLDVGKVSIGGLIDRLEKSGHVKRRPDPVDRRVKRILITKKGYGVIAKMRKVGEVLNTKILKSIPSGRVLEAEDTLYQIRVNLRALLGQD